MSDVTPVQVEPAAHPPVARWRAVVPVLALAALIAVADQLTKLWIVAAIGRAQPVHEIVLLPGWFVLQYAENTGAAFGLFRDGGWLLAGLAAVVVVIIVTSAPRLGHEAGPGLARWRLLGSLGLVLGGAIGNLLDRFQHGYVVDFILVPSARLTWNDRIYQFPNFNVADSAITVGIFLLLLSLFFAPERKT